MTIRNDFVSLWDNGTDKLCLFAISPEYQYEYIIGKPCITVGIAYENKRFKGSDTFTLFDHFYIDSLEKKKASWGCCNRSTL